MFVVALDLRLLLTEEAAMEGFALLVAELPAKRQETETYRELHVVVSSPLNYIN